MFLKELYAFLPIFVAMIVIYLLTLLYTLYAKHKNKQEISGLEEKANAEDSTQNEEDE